LPIALYILHFFPLKRKVLKVWYTSPPHNFSKYEEQNSNVVFEGLEKEKRNMRDVYLYVIKARVTVVNWFSKSLPLLKLKQCLITQQFLWHTWPQNFFFI
jgi:hypothetical protein